MIKKPRSCQFCNDTFFPFRYKQKYCSTNCAEKMRDLRKHQLKERDFDPTRKCDNCGKTFAVPFCGKRGRFCENKCKIEFHKNQKLLKLKQAASLTPLQSRDCKFCGEAFVPSRRCNYKQQFCSKKCKTDHNADEQKKKRDNKRALIFCDCPICDKCFSPKKSLKEIYCSKKCRLAVGKRIYHMMRYCYKMTETTKADHAHKVLGYSPTELLKHLQSFPQWERLKLSSWHLDHIFPIIAFVRKGVTDIKVICSLDNLQPLAGRKNCSKGDTYDVQVFENWLQSQNQSSCSL